MQILGSPTIILEAGMSNMVLHAIVLNGIHSHMNHLSTWDDGEEVRIPTWHMLTILDARMPYIVKNPMGNTSL